MERWRCRSGIEPLSKRKFKFADNGSSLEQMFLDVFGVSIFKWSQERERERQMDEDVVEKKRKPHGCDVLLTLLMLK